MDPDLLTERVAALRRATEVMSDNVAYIEKELPTLQAPQHEVHHILAVCRAFAAALSDVEVEILGLEAFPDRYSEYAKTISRCLEKEVESMHLLVLRLRDLVATPISAALNVRVEESAANILFAYKDLTNVLAATGSPR